MRVIPCSIPQCFVALLGRKVGMWSLVGYSYTGIKFGLVLFCESGTL